MSDATMGTPDVNGAYQATPRAELLQRLMSSTTPKNELEWFARDEINRLHQEMERAWGIIANAYGGNWDLAPPASGWQKAAERWRDEAWHRVVSSIERNEEKIDAP